MNQLQDKLKYYLGTGLKGKAIPFNMLAYKDTYIDCEFNCIERGRIKVDFFDVNGSNWGGKSGSLFEI